MDHFQLYAVQHVADCVTKQVRKLQAEGVVPEGVNSFAALHDYVDTNLLGDFEELLPAEPEDGDYFMEVRAAFMNAVQDQVDYKLRNNK